MYASVLLLRLFQVVLQHSNSRDTRYSAYIKIRATTATHHHYSIYNHVLACFFLFSLIQGMSTGLTCLYMIFILLQLIECCQWWRVCLPILSMLLLLLLSLFSFIITYFILFFIWISKYAMAWHHNHWACMHFIFHSLHTRAHAHTISEACSTLDCCIIGIERCVTLAIRIVDLWKHQYFNWLLNIECIVFRWFSCWDQSWWLLMFQRFGQYDGHSPRQTLFSP